jgi:hypothetical protein
MTAMKLLSVVASILLLGGCGVDASSGSQAGEPEEPETQVSDFRSVNGTRFLIASLHAERNRSSYSSDSYYGGAALNHLFYDLDSRNARWLLPGLDQRILETRPLTSAPDSTTGDASISPRNGGGGEVRSFLYRVVSEDTNGDGDLDSDDRSALASSGPSGAGYTVLVESAERFLGAFWVDEAHALLIYETDGAVRGVEFDVEKREVTRRLDFPAAPASAPAA